MKTAKELALIASCIQLKRDSNLITQAIIEDIQKEFEHIVSIYGSEYIDFNIGKTSLREIAKEHSIDNTDFVIQESHIRKYFSELGFFITFKNIGLIEDKFIKLSLSQL